MIRVERGEFSGFKIYDSCCVNFSLVAVFMLFYIKRHPKLDNIKFPFTKQISLSLFRERTERKSSHRISVHSPNELLKY